MTGRYLFNRVRYLLHDTDRVNATAQRTFSTTSIEIALNEAQVAMMKGMIAMRPQPCVLLRSVSKDVAFTAPGAVPDDFLALVCGTKAGAYRPMEDSARGQFAAGYSGMKYVYVAGGQVFGDIDHLYYWRLPSKIQATDSPMTDFPDAVYHVIKMLAVESLLIQFQKSAPHRVEFCQADLQRKIATLR